MTTTAGPVRVTSSDEHGTPLGRVRATGFVDDGPAFVPGPRRIFESFALVLVHGGSGTYVDDCAPAREVLPGDTILVVPGHPHWYGPPPGGRWSEIFLVFDGPAFDVLHAGGVLDVGEPIRRAEPLGPWVERLSRFAERPRPATLTERELEVLELAALLVELRGRPSGEDPVPRPIGRARDRLGRDLTAQLDLRELAAEVGLPYETFRKRFRAATGRSPAAYRLDRRVEAAQTLLRMTDLTHAAIAQSLGFADEFHFAKRFRARVGAGPRDYRRSASRPPLG